MSLPTHHKININKQKLPQYTTKKTRNNKNGDMILLIFFCNEIKKTNTHRKEQK